MSKKGKETEDGKRVVDGNTATPFLGSDCCHIETGPDLQGVDSLQALNAEWEGKGGENSLHVVRGNDDNGTLVAPMGLDLKSNLTP